MVKQLTELEYYKLKAKLFEITVNEQRLMEQKTNLLLSHGIQPGNLSFNDKDFTVSLFDAKGEIEK